MTRPADDSWHDTPGIACHPGAAVRTVLRALAVGAALALATAAAGGYLILR